MQKVAIQRNKKSEPQVENEQAIPMLSELYIQLPKPNPVRRISHANLNSPFLNQYQICFSPDAHAHAHDQLTLPNSSNEYSPLVIPSKHHPQSRQRSEGEIILGWIRNIFQKKNLLGPHWEEKIKNKRANLLKSAFERLKEERQSGCTPYLQTQSRHKPHFNKQKHLILMGFQKLNEIISNMVMKTKRTVFSKILRHLAFQHAPLRSNSKLDSYALQQESTGSISGRAPAREERSNQQSPLNGHKITPVFIEVGTPRKLAKAADYVVMPQAQLKTPIKQVQSSKNLIFSANEYALTPVSPVREQLTDKKKPKKESNFIVSDSKMSRSSEKTRELVNSKPQPHQVAIGGIGGNFKYEFNQHNYIVVQPDPIHHHPSPPSPLSHQLTQTIKFHTPEVKQLNLQPLPQAIPLIMKQSTQLIERRDPNYVRPHSHNPFLHQNNTNAPTGSQKMVEERAQVKKSRSISATGNIKISFMSKQEIQRKEAKLKGNDYHVEEKLQYQDAHKLGTAENRRMRQHYQLNSYGNELIPQDYIPSPQTPNYLYSTPASPKPQELHAKHIHVNYVTPGPQSPLTPRSPRGFGFQSYLPISPEPRDIPQQMKQSVQIVPSESNKRLPREKILVTSSQRQK